MGLLDNLRSMLGLRAQADATRDADPEDLFEMSTAAVTIEASLGFEPAGKAALCFSAVDSTAFDDAVAEVEAILEAGEVETGTAASFVRDDHGYDWVVLGDTNIEDLLTSIHFAADTLIEAGFGSRLLAALFAFEREETTVYWVYSFRRGTYYPFVPAGDHERDRSLEFKVESTLGNELDIEPDKEYWYPLWPDTAGSHPWE